MWMKLPYGKFPCSFGRVAFVNNKYFITQLWPASKIILFSRHVNYNYFLFLSSYVRWLANNFTPKAHMWGTFFTAILRNKQARNTRFIKPISVKLTPAQTFFRGVGITLGENVTTVIICIFHCIQARFKFSELNQNEAQTAFEQLAPAEVY